MHFWGESHCLAYYCLLTSLGVKEVLGGASAEDNQTRVQILSYFFRKHWTVLDYCIGLLNAATQFPSYSAFNHEAADSSG